MKCGFRVFRQCGQSCRQIFNLNTTRFTRFDERCSHVFCFFVGYIRLIKFCFCQIHQGILELRILRILSLCLWFWVLFPCILRRRCQSTKQISCWLCLHLVVAMDTEIDVLACSWSFGNRSTSCQEHILYILWWLYSWLALDLVERQKMLLGNSTIFAHLELASKPHPELNWGLSLSLNHQFCFMWSINPGNCLYFCCLGIHSFFLLQAAQKRWSFTETCSKTCRLLVC